MLSPMQVSSLSLTAAKGPMQLPQKLLMRVIGSAVHVLRDTERILPIQLYGSIVRTRIAVCYVIPSIDTKLRHVEGIRHLQLTHTTTYSPRSRKVSPAVLYFPSP